MKSLHLKSNFYSIPNFHEILWQISSWFKMSYFLSRKSNEIMGKVLLLFLCERWNITSRRNEERKALIGEKYSTKPNGMNQSEIYGRMSYVFLFSYSLFNDLRAFAFTYDFSFNFAITNNISFLLVTPSRVRRDCKFLICAYLNDIVACSFTLIECCQNLMMEN